MMLRVIQVLAMDLFSSSIESFQKRGHDRESTQVSALVRLFSEHLRSLATLRISPRCYDDVEHLLDGPGNMK